MCVCAPSRIPISRIPFQEQHNDWICWWQWSPSLPLCSAIGILFRYINRMRMYGTCYWMLYTLNVFLILSSLCVWLIHSWHNGYFNFRVDHNSSLVLLKVSELSSASIHLFYSLPFAFAFNLYFIRRVQRYLSILPPTHYCLLSDHFWTFGIVLWICRLWHNDYRPSVRCTLLFMLLYPMICSLCNK